MEKLHIGIIPDGGRRWAKQNKINLTEAYLESMDKLEKLIDIGFKSNIKEISIYLLSKENLKRPEKELNAVYLAEQYFVETNISSLKTKYDIDICVCGDIDLLPSTFRDSIIKSLTNNKRSLRINLLIAYNPIDEISNSISNSETGAFTSIENLCVKTEVDYVIRTGGGNCPISNFLPLQCGYAFVYIVDEMFNDFTLQKFEDINNQFIQQKINKGK